MHITSLEEYSLRCAVQLARHHSEPPAPLSATQLAQLEGLSTQYVSKILFLFKKAGIVQSIRGSQGGFSLTHAPKNLSLHCLLKALRTEKNISTLAFSEFCQKHTGQEKTCRHLPACSVRALWFLSQSFFSKTLSYLTLADLLEEEKTFLKKLKKTFQTIALQITQL